MKYEELKSFNCVDDDLQEFCRPRLVYSKSDVDAAIAELNERDRKTQRALWLARVSCLEMCKAVARHCREIQGGIMIRYNFTKVSREQLAKLAENAIKALADKSNFDVFTLTLDVDGDENDIEAIKEAQT